MPDYCFKAIRNAGITALGVRGADSVVVISTKRTADNLYEAEGRTNVHRVAPAVFTALVGYQPDCKSVLQRAHYESVNFSLEYGYDWTVDGAARRMADIAQLYTQYAGNRPPAVSQVYFGIDSELGPQLWRTDPSGFVAGMRAGAVGAKEVETDGYLEAAFKEDPEVRLTLDQCKRLALSSLAKVCTQDLQPESIEAFFVTADKPTELQQMPLEEIRQLFRAEEESDD